MKRCTVMRIDAFKKVARILGRRTGIKHCVSLQRLSFACRYENWLAVQRDVESLPAGEPNERGAIDPQTWVEQIAAVYGAAAQDAFTREQLLVWHARVSGTSRRDVAHLNPSEGESAERDAVPVRPLRVQAPVITYKSAPCHRRRFSEVARTQDRAATGCSPTSIPFASERLLIKGGQHVRP